MPRSDKIDRLQPGRSRSRRPADTLLAALAAFVVLSISFAVYWTLGRIEAQVKQQMSHSLQTVVATTREGIGIWVNSITDRVDVIARRPEVISDIQAQVRLPREQ